MKTYLVEWPIWKSINQPPFQLMENPLILHISADSKKLAEEQAYWQACEFLDHFAPGSSEQLSQSDFRVTGELTI